MSDKNPLPNSLPSLEEIILAATQTAATQAYQLGFYEGFQAGQLVGYVEGVNALTPAISDGLRHGSPACGKAMQGLKNMHAIPTEHKEEDEN